MKIVTLGRSGIRANNAGLELGALQKMSFEKSKNIVEKAVDAGIDFYDIGLPVEELQKRIGHAMAGKRSKVVLAGSFEPCEPKEFKKGLEQLLRRLMTDYIDLCQIHDPDYLPRTGDSEGFYDALTQAKEAGYIRSIGITTGTDFIALNALEYGWYDTLQYPWSDDSQEEDLDMIPFAHEALMGTISVPFDTANGDVAILEKKWQWLQAQEQHLGLWSAEESSVDALIAQIKKG